MVGVRTMQVSIIAWLLFALIGVANSATSDRFDSDLIQSSDLIPLSQINDLIDVELNSDQPRENNWESFDSLEIDHASCHTSYSNAKWLELPLDPTQPDGKKFSQFFYTYEKFDANKPSILLVLGGPGQVAFPAFDLIGNLRHLANIVLFHFRGSGCSSFPKSASFDAYIRTNFAINDIEAIRKSLGIKAWNIVYGQSYGTMLTHVYASLFPSSISQIVLEGVFTNWTRFSHFDYVSILGNTISKLIDSDSTGVLTNKGIGTEERKEITQSIYKFLRDIQPETIWSLVSYQASDRENLFSNLSSSFANIDSLLTLFEAMYSGWSPIDESRRLLQSTIVASLVDSYLGQQSWSSNLEQMLDLSKSRRKQFYTPSKMSLTDFTAMYVKSLVAKRVLQVVYDEDLKHYNPQKYRHSVPTLIVQGDADVATPSEGAFQFFLHVLHGSKVAYLVRGGPHLGNLRSICQYRVLESLTRGTLDKPAIFREVSELLTNSEICKSPFGSQLSAILRSPQESLH